jgi:hypothetical protein
MVCDRRAHIRHYWVDREVNYQRAELVQAWVVNRVEDSGHNRETTYLGGRKKP